MAQDTTSVLSQRAHMQVFVCCCLSACLPTCLALLLLVLVQVHILQHLFQQLLVAAALAAVAGVHQLVGLALELLLLGLVLGLWLLRQAVGPLQLQQQLGLVWPQTHGRPAAAAAATGHTRFFVSADRTAPLQCVAREPLSPDPVVAAHVILLLWLPCLPMNT